MSTVVEGGAGPGARLKRAREARELAIQEVADTLNITPRVVRLLESESWSELPAAAFTRGYLRAFARLVGQDPEEIGEAYSAVVGSETTAGSLRQVEVNRRGFTEMIHKQPGAVLSAAVLVAAGVAGVVLWTVWPSADDRARNTEIPAMRAPVPQSSTRPSTSQTARAAPASSVRPEPAAPVAEPDETILPDEDGAAIPLQRMTPAPATEAASTTIDSPESSPAVIAASAMPGMEDEEITTIVEEDVAEGEALVRRITPQGEDRLTLSFVNDCWVEVKNGEGLDLYSDLSRSGDVLELVGAAPFRLRLGYAPGVELAFNQERVVLTPHTRNNIASIVLGQ